MKTLKTLGYKHTVPRERFMYANYGLNPILSARQGMLAALSIELLNIKELTDDCTIHIRWSQSISTVNSGTEVTLEAAIVVRGE